MDFINKVELMYHFEMTLFWSDIDLGFVLYIFEISPSEMSQMSVLSVYSQGGIGI